MKNTNRDFGFSVKRKGFINIAIIVIVTLVVIAVGYFVARKNGKFISHTNEPIATLTTTTDAISSVDTTNWKTYRNEKYGFEFSYPSDYGDIVSSTDSFGLIGSGVISIDPNITSEYACNITRVDAVETSLQSNDNGRLTLGITPYQALPLIKENQWFTLNLLKLKKQIESGIINWQDVYNNKEYVDREDGWVENIGSYRVYQHNIGGDIRCPSEVLISEFFNDQYYLALSLLQLPESKNISKGIISTFKFIK